MPMRGTVTARKPKSIGETPRKQLASKAACKSGPKPGDTRKPPKYRSTNAAIRESKRYQSSTNFLMKKLPFQRLVREIAQENRNEHNFEFSAFWILQKAAEAYLITLFEGTKVSTGYSKRVIIMSKDLAFAQRI